MFNFDFFDDISRVKKIDSKSDSDSDNLSSTYDDINDNSIDDQSAQSSKSIQSTMKAITVELQALRKKLQINKLKLKAEKFRVAVRKEDASQTSSVAISKTKTIKFDKLSNYHDKSETEHREKFRQTILQHLKNSNYFSFDKIKLPTIGII